MENNFDPARTMSFLMPAFYVLMLAAGYAIAKFVTRGRLEKMRAIAPLLGARAVDGFMGPRLEGLHEGRGFTVQIVTGGKGAPPVLKLGIQTFLGISFTAYRFSVLAGLLDGFFNRVMSGDRAFDLEFIFSGRDETALSAFLSDARRREGARNLFLAGYSKITLKNGKAEALKSIGRPEDELEAGRLKSALGDLARLTAA